MILDVQADELEQQQTAPSRTRSIKTIDSPSRPRQRRKPAARARRNSTSLSLPTVAAAKGDFGTGLWARLARFFRMRTPEKRLRVCESVSLGEKRFLAIVRVDSESFLLGGSTGNVSMLAKLQDPGAFSAMLQTKSAEAGCLQ